MIEYKEGISLKIVRILMDEARGQGYPYPPRIDTCEVSRVRLPLSIGLH